jgi:hypothetical protein
MVHIQKPVKVDARQLTDSNGEELANWINESPGGYHSEYWPARTFANGLGMTARLTIVESNDRIEWTIYHQEWVVYFPEDLEFRVYGKDEFPQKFEKVA